MALEEIVHEIADDEIGLSGTLVHDATRQYLRGAVPLDVDCSAAAQGAAAQLRPAGRAPGLALEQDFEVMAAEPRVVGDGIAETGPGVQIT
jgi:hypothetical protein